MVEIKPCTCQHKQQDAMYGKGNRVKNQTQSGNYRCSVCGNIEGISKKK